MGPDNPGKRGYRIHTLFLTLSLSHSPPPRNDLRKFESRRLRLASLPDPETRLLFGLPWVPACLFIYSTVPRLLSRHDSQIHPFVASPLAHLFTHSPPPSNDFQKTSQSCAAT